MIINSFNHFRAIAILLIMVGHSYDVTGMQFETLFEVSIKNILTGGTSLFVFISGFLFYCVFYPKYQYKKFLVKKSYNVLIPYIILGFLPVFFHVWLKKDGFDGYFLPRGEGVLNEYLVPFLKYYISGSFLTAYWYIPFIMVTFALSPLHMKYIKGGLKVQLLLIFSLSIVSALIHRPVSNINVFHSVLYFTPIYLIGITAGIHREEVYKHLKGKELYLLAIVIVLAAFQAFLGIEGNYHKPIFDYQGIDIMYIQKIALCFFFMIWLNRFELYNNKWIHMIAATSFAAFFMHPFVLWLLQSANINFIKLDSWAVLGIFVVVLSVFCVLIAKLVKEILPKHSRYFIGY